MTMARLFIDGSEGTTGLEIHQRLAGRKDLEIIQIEPERRKDVETRRACYDRADLVILCLPDAAARQAAGWIDDGSTRIIDASSAHRTDPQWVYGLAELGPKQRELVRSARRVTNPGCHATGFVLATAPLIDAGIVDREASLFVSSITGFSGGGKKLIAAYQQGDPEALSAPRPYALSLKHKHLPEMKAVCGLAKTPLFVPVVGPFYRGMLVSVPLPAESLRRQGGRALIRQALADRYAEEPFVTVAPLDAEPYLDDGGYLSPLGCNGTNRVELFVFGNDEQVLVVARLDNLGKGASGAAVQNLNLMLGVEESRGLA